MVPLLFPLVRRIGMNQRTQGAPVDDQPGNEGAELPGVEEVDFEHGDWVGAYGAVPEGVDAEFRD